MLFQKAKWRKEEHSFPLKYFSLHPGIHYVGSNDFALCHVCTLGTKKIINEANYLADQALLFCNDSFRKYDF